MVYKILWVSIAILQAGNLKPCEIEACAVCVVKATLPQLAQRTLGRAGRKREQRWGSQWVKR